VIRDEQLRRFFSGTPNEHQDPRAVAPMRVTRREPSAGKGKWWLAIFGLVLVFSIGGALALVLLPKAEVSVTPLSVKRTVDGQFTGHIIAPVGTDDPGIIPVRLIEKQIPTNIAFKATGTTQSGGQKARGAVVITNDFSPQSQTLIATTRLESPDGKIFRLMETVTVPGQTTTNGRREPGAIEVKVVADEPGDAYNIAPTTFTIPGFKGNPKFNRFVGRSSKPMTGGTVSNENLPTVLSSDIDRALDDARAEAKKRLLSETAEELLDEERLLEETMEVRETGEIQLPIVGTAGKEFELDGTFTVRAFAVSEKALREKLFARNPYAKDGASFRTASAAISYLDVLPKYSEGTVVLRVRADLSYVADIDRDALRRELAGKNDDEIKGILERSASIQKMSIAFKPEFVLRSFPNDPERIIITIADGE
jgi:hypothetical protein